MSFSDRVAFVVGAGGGFGGAIAERLAADGAACALVGRSEKSIKSVYERIVAQGGRAIVSCADVRSKNAIAEAYEETVRTLGEPTILVCAAAVPGPFGPIGDIDPEEWWSAITLHLKAPMLLVDQLLPAMLRLGQGHVIVLASLVGEMVYPYLSAYSIGKAAQVSLVAHAAVEHRNSGVSFFAIQPGVADTKMTEQTLNSADFQKWAPEAVKRIRGIVQNTDSQKSFQICAERCVELASGRYDVLSGRFLQPEDDLEELALEARA